VQTSPGSARSIGRAAAFLIAGAVEPAAGRASALFERIGRAPVEATQAGCQGDGPIRFPLKLSRAVAN
jgi:hypothetical protein